MADSGRSWMSILRSTMGARRSAMGARRSMMVGAWLCLRRRGMKTSRRPRGGGRDVGVEEVDVMVAAEEAEDEVGMVVVEVVGMVDVPPLQLVQLVHTGHTAGPHVPRCIHATASRPQRTLR